MIDAAVDGIVSVVVADVRLPITGLPEFTTHVLKTCPAGAAFALMFTTAPAAYEPEPVPLVTVNAKVGGGKAT